MTPPGPRKWAAMNQLMAKLRREGRHNEAYNYYLTNKQLRYMYACVGMGFEKPLEPPDDWRLGDPECCDGVKLDVDQLFMASSSPFGPIPTIKPTITFSAHPHSPLSQTISFDTESELPQPPHPFLKRLGNQTRLPRVTYDPRSRNTRRKVPLRCRKLVRWTDQESAKQQFHLEEESGKLQTNQESMLHRQSSTGMGAQEGEALSHHEPVNMVKVSHSTNIGVQQLSSQRTETLSEGTSSFDIMTIL